MKRRFAIPVNNGLLTQHFGHCSHFVFIDIENSKIISDKTVEAPEHQPGLLPPWIVERGVTDIIAGGIGNKAIEIFNKHSVNVYAGAPEGEPKELVNMFLDKTLELKENSCNH